MGYSIVRGATMPDAIIEVTDLTKTYETSAVMVHALRGVSLTVERGEMVAIMGPSGCGKTTLLNCLSGIDDLTAGTILIDGADLASMDDNTKTAYRARRMGFVFQFYNLLPVLSAVENVELPLLVSGTAAAEARQLALASLYRVVVGELAGQRPSQSSVGMWLRAAISRT